MADGLPCVEFAGEGKDAGASGVGVAVDGKALALFPELHGADVALEVGGYRFPRFETFTREVLMGAEGRDGSVAGHGLCQSLNGPGAR